jgi:Ran GTPase-activating protein (RanGAP) involved in mRNA processing and transport
MQPISTEAFVRELKANDASQCTVRFGARYAGDSNFIDSNFDKIPGSCSAIADALAKNTSISALTLGKGLIFGAAGAKMIGEAIGVNCALKEICLDGIGYPTLSATPESTGLADVEGIAEGLAKSKSLTTLKVCVVNTKGMSAIGRALGKNSSIVELVIERPVGLSMDEGATGIAEGVAKNKTLRKLDVSQCRILKSGAEAIFGAMKTNSCLVELDISSNGIGDSEMMAEGVATLQKLNVNLCGITKEGGRALGRALETSSSLVELDISSNNIGDVGARSLAGGLTKNTSLKVLKAFGCNVKGPGSKAIGIALGSNSTLEELRWGTPAYEEYDGKMRSFQSRHPRAFTWCNHLHKVGALGFAEGLTKNKVLKVLDLSLANIESNGAQAIGKSLGVNSHLCELNLQATNFSAKGLKCLGASLGSTKNGALTSLNLSDNWFGDAGAVALGKGMWCNQSLKSLQLVTCRFKAAGAKKLSNGLHFSRVETVDLSGNYIGDSGASAIANAIAWNRNLADVRIGPALVVTDFGGTNYWNADGRYNWSMETRASFASAIRSSTPRATTLVIKEGHRTPYKDLIAHCERQWNDRQILLAFAMGLQSRLGEGSLVQAIGGDLFRLVAVVGFAKSLELRD